MILLSTERRLEAVLPSDIKIDQNDRVDEADFCRLLIPTRSDIRDLRPLGTKSSGSVTHVYVCQVCMYATWVSYQSCDGHLNLGQLK